MAYKKYIVKQGDCISSIAFKYGFFPDTIWNDSKNSKLRQDRKNPNVLKPGDVVYMCDKEEKDESCPSEERHRFKRKGVPEKLVIQFRTIGEPRANEAYVLDIDGALSEGQTDENGIAEVWIPPNAMKGKISFRDGGDEYELELGDLDPITEVSGIQQRLQNMGFYEGPIDGKMSGQIEHGIGDFQKARGLNPTGKPDENTRNEIEQAYGG
jgi:hypothetical protein